MLGFGLLVFMFLACFIGGAILPRIPTRSRTSRRPTSTAPSRPVRRRRTGSGPTSSVVVDSLSRVLHGGQVVAEGRARCGVAVDVDRRGDRRARWRLLPRLARRAAHAVHRPLDRAVRPTVPGGGGSPSAPSSPWVRSARSISADPLGMTLLLSILLWGSIARVVRGAHSHAQGTGGVVDAARAVGASDTRIIVRTYCRTASEPDNRECHTGGRRGHPGRRARSRSSASASSHRHRVGAISCPNAIATTEESGGSRCSPAPWIFLTVLAVNFVGDGVARRAATRGDGCRP